MHIFQFEAGDVVALRSGGPSMTVTAAERIAVDKPVAADTAAQRRADGSPLVVGDPGYTGSAQVAASPPNPTDPTKPSGYETATLGGDGVWRNSAGNVMPAPASGVIGHVKAGDVGPAVKCMWQATNPAGETKTAEATFPAGLLDLKDRIGNHAEHVAAQAHRIRATYAAASRVAGVPVNLGPAGPLDRVA